MTKRKRSQLRSTSRPKRRRHRATSFAAVVDPDLLPPAKRDAPTLVVVTGLPADCSVMELKSRFEMYGPISRLNVDRELGFGNITFRNSSSAEAAVADAADPLSEVVVASKKVRVTWPDDPLSQWTAGVKISSNVQHQPSSKLLQPVSPLSRLGRSHKRLLGACSDVTTSVPNVTNEPYKGRDIVAYDDLL